MWSRATNWGLFTTSDLRERPSAEIRVVEVEKLRTFYDLCGARARPSAVVEVKKLRTFFVFYISAVCAQPSAAEIRVVDQRGRCAKTECFSILNMLARPSARIVRAEALSLWRRANFVIVACEVVFGSCRVVCAAALGVARPRGRSPPGPRKLF